VRQLNKLLVPVFLLQPGQVNKHNKYGIKHGVHSRDVTFSRNHETEADQIGLTLMAIAGIIQKKQLLSGLEWQQILPEKLHLSLVHTRQMHRE
jgi:hypothetical protein